MNADGMGGDNETGHETIGGAVLLNLQSAGPTAPPSQAREDASLEQVADGHVRLSRSKNSSNQIVKQTNGDGAVSRPIAASTAPATLAPTRMGQ